MVTFYCGPDYISAREEAFRRSGESANFAAKGPPGKPITGR